LSAAIENIVHERLENNGLEKLRLPFGAAVTDRHLNIFASPDLNKKSRVVITFGESFNMLGILALRAVNGPGGINKGSLVSLVQELKEQASSSDDPSPPGIILANTGQLYWSPEGGRSLEPVRQHAAPMPSSVHRGKKEVTKINSVPRNESVNQHVAYMFDEVVPHLLGAGSQTQVDVIGIGDGADAMEGYFNEAENWDKYEGKLHAMVILGGSFDMDKLKCEGFKSFLERVRLSFKLDL
jgi:hypothetical protein